MPARTRRTHDPAPRGLLIAAEGLDGSGKSAGLETLARWLERKGRRTHQVDWPPSRLVGRAVRSRGGRQATTSTVAALLAAAEAAERCAREVGPRLARGEVVLADRYAWTSVAREIARGVDPDWAATLYRCTPAPDLILFHRQEPALALARALATRPSVVTSGAVAGPYGEFLDRLFRAFDDLVAGRTEGPWPTHVLVVDSTEPGEGSAVAVREAVRPWLTDDRR